MLEEWEFKKLIKLIKLIKLVILCTQQEVEQNII